MGSVRRAVAVEIESPPPELSAVEEAYRRIVEEAAVYVAERGRLEGKKREELYRRFRELYPLPAQLVQQAMNQGVEVGKSFLEARRDGRVHKPRPEVRRVAIRFAKDSWSYRKTAASAAPVRLALSLPGGRREVWIKPHRRLWLYWWKALRGEAELASTLMVKRRRGRWYAIFAFDVQPRGEPPAEVVTFDVNENTVAVARVSLLATVDAVARWNRQYLDPAVYSIRTDFGRLAKRYEAVRGRKLEELRGKYPFAGRDGEERAQNVADAREFRRFAGRLRERRRKEGRVKQVAREVARSPAVIVTEELGKNPQEGMIGVEEKAKKGVRKKVEKGELRHRIKQTPFRKILRAVEDKAAEGGSAVFYASSFRNSKACPIHFAKLEDGGDWHTLRCPHGHAVDRDAAAVLNMLWKTTPTGWVKGVWWDLRDVKRRLERERGLVPKELAGRKNPLVPWPVVRAVWASLRSLKASPQWPAVLARPAPRPPPEGPMRAGRGRLPAGHPPSGRRSATFTVTQTWPIANNQAAVI
ncbi:zinc ribbon domain-containing protein [Thermoproteus sp. CP80]|uniref:zinc ribbon domain-containing protein n=1 Tax=Thermoproteus sp. CP80 TaxID=1650659 RepID=UPI001389CC27|nr:zinc ribbon domain-containing protein [Thermoproteus sp. CP80]